MLNTAIEIRCNGRRFAQVDARDRGLQYGDGLFETMRVRAHRIALLEAHLRRLRDGCRRLRLPMPAEQLLRREIAAAARRWPEAVLKLVLTRGTGARGYRTPLHPRPLRLLLCAPCGVDVTPAPVSVRLCRTPLSQNPHFAGLKTLNRQDSVAARSEWRDPRIAEGLMRDSAGHIVCGTMTNVFAVRRGRVSTPLLDRGGVSGVMRGWVLEQGRRDGLRITEGRLRMRDLEQADEIFLTNAVIGIWSVGGVRVPAGWIRPTRTDLAERLRAEFRRFLAASPARRPRA